MLGRITAAVTIHFHCKQRCNESEWWLNSLPVSTILPNILFYVPQKKVKWVWNDMRGSKWWQNFHFWGYYPFKDHKCGSGRCWERSSDPTRCKRGMLPMWHDGALVITNLSNRVKNKTMNPKKRQWNQSVRKHSNKIPYPPPCIPWWVLNMQKGDGAVEEYRNKGLMD